MATVRDGDGPSAWSGLDHSSTMGVELVAGILTWSGVGWLLDRWLGTGPWLLGVGALVGYGAGLTLVWLRGRRMEAAATAGTVRGRAGAPLPGGDGA